jgi:hypothetical protein
MVISLEGNEKIIYFIYATEIKLPIIPLYHLCIPPYTTCVSCGDIQLISDVRFFHPGPFQQWYRVVWSSPNSERADAGGILVLTG